MSKAPMTTTLARIKAHKPCADGWRKLLDHLGKTEADDEPLPYSVIFESNGLKDALWACRAEPRYDREWRLYAVWCAEQVEHLMTDPRSREALKVARQFANGQATQRDLDAAAAAALASVLGAVGAASRAAAEAAWGASWKAAKAAAEAAVGDTSGEAAWGAAEAAWGAQKAEFLRVVGA